MTILQDTILKLVFRQGSDNDRRHIVFTSGEPVYTTNTRRLFVGNGSLSGGDVVGNLFLGYETSLASLALNKSPAVVGDFGFVTDSNKLYTLSGNTGSNTTDWKEVGGIYTSGSNLISINSSNVITLNALSANSVNIDLIDAPLILNSGRIGLSANLPFQRVSTKTITVSSGLTSSANGLSSTGSPMNPLSANIIIQSNQLYSKYDGNTSTVDYSRNITSVSKLSTGHYVFNYAQLPTANLIPNVQIFGITPSVGYAARPTYISSTACHVQVLSADGSKADAVVTILLSY
jgi:hypothetical protein